MKIMLIYNCVSVHSLLDRFYLHFKNTYVKSRNNENQPILQIRLNAHSIIIILF